jgi:hypothetical protein
MRCDVLLNQMSDRQRLARAKSMLDAEHTKIFKGATYWKNINAIVSKCGMFSLRFNADRSVSCYEHFHSIIPDSPLVPRN